MLDDTSLHEGEGGFKKKRSSINSLYTLVVQGQLREGKKTHVLSWMSKKPV